MKTMHCLSGLALLLQTGLSLRIEASEPASPAAANETAIKEGAEVSLSGKLKGVMSIGGETTGWALEYQSRAGRRQIEVDCSGLAPGSVAEGAVRITGKVFEKTYLERGRTLIIKATKIEKQRADAKVVDSAVRASLAKLCEEQRLKIQALEHDREKMAQEIKRLEDKNRSLNETLDKIRSHAGDGGIRPTSSLHETPGFH